MVLQFQAFLGILEHIPHGQGELLYFMKSVIKVYTPNSEPSKEFECEKAKKNICAISSMIFCPSDGPQVHERVESLYFVLSSPCCCSSKILGGISKPGFKKRVGSTYASAFDSHNDISQDFQKGISWNSVSNSFMFVF